MSAFKVLLFIWLAFVVGFSHAGVPPIKNMPDYNGTYWGSPGTGGDCDSATINCDSTAGKQMFSTLYRDNYIYRAKCAGENCGSHAGVDIRVASGTPVVASLAGKVVETGCKEGSGTGDFGGAVVIEANNPYVSGNKVYLVYAHLDDWEVVNEGDFVSEGQLVGYSGGVPKKTDGSGGKCPGASDGPHLHFQVDKNPPDANGRPWFPLSISVSTNTADTNFSVPKYTHNPLPFVTGKAYNFTFSEAKNSELWVVSNGNATGVSSGSLWIDSESKIARAGRSGYLGNTSCSAGSCSREITLNADIFKKVMLDIDFKCPAGKAYIKYRGPDDVWQSAKFDYTTAKKYYLSFSSLTTWKGIITDFLIQPSDGCIANSGSKEYFIKQVYFYK